MRNVLMCFVSTLLFFGCSDSQGNENDEKSNLAILEGNIKTYLLAKIDDPSSYAPISTVGFDTIYEGSLILKEMIREIESEYWWIKSNKEQIESHKVTFTALKVLDEDLKKDIEHSEKLIKRLTVSRDSLANILKVRKKLEGYIFVHSYRLKNKFGALVKKNSFVRVDTNYAIEYLRDDY